MSGVLLLYQVTELAVSLCRLHVEFESSLLYSKFCYYPSSLYRGLAVAPDKRRESNPISDGRGRGCKQGGIKNTCWVVLSSKPRLHANHSPAPLMFCATNTVSMMPKPPLRQDRNDFCDLEYMVCLQPPGQWFLSFVQSW